MEGPHHLTSASGGHIPLARMAEHPIKAVHPWNVTRPFTRQEAACHGKLTHAQREIAAVKN